MKKKDTYALLKKHKYWGGEYYIIPKYIYRYVCPNCLDTFLDKDYSDYKVCWKCGQWLVVIPKMK